MRAGRPGRVPLRRYSVILTSIATACARPEPGLPSGTPWAGALDSGGETTVFVFTSEAFAQPAANLDLDALDRFFEGQRVFRASFSAGSGPYGGLGPAFNARSCTECHERDSRGAPPGEGEAPASLVLRLTPAGEDASRPAPPARQWSAHSVDGGRPDGEARVSWRTVLYRLRDGTVVELRRPSYTLDGPAFAQVTISPRIAPALAGAGLLEGIPASALKALADPSDRDGDHISGRIAHLADPKRGGVVVGRFGWKAEAATVRQQVASALLLDMGIAPPFAREELTPGHAAEMESATFDALVSYVRTLAVPGREAPSRQVARGARLFTRTGCAHCHVPTHRTGGSDIEALAGQLIHPYTDLLLHDMGAGLADGDGLSQAQREWRTPPLWGVGLLERANGHRFLLHDGRARDLTEAILWHGGEGAESRDAFASLPAQDRAALVAFVESL